MASDSRACRPASTHDSSGCGNPLFSAAQRSVAYVAVLRGVVPFWQAVFAACPSFPGYEAYELSTIGTPLGGQHDRDVPIAQSPCNIDHSPDGSLAGPCAGNTDLGVGSWR